MKAIANKLYRFWICQNYAYCKASSYLASQRCDGLAVADWDSRAAEWDRKLARFDLNLRLSK